MSHDRLEAHRKVFGVTHAYDDDAGVFAIAPDRIGFGVIAAPLAGYDEAMQEKLNLLLNLPYPVKSILQFCLFSSPDIEAFIDRFDAMRTGTRDPVLKEMMGRRKQFLRESTLSPVDRVSGIRLRNVNLVITATLPSSPANSGLLGARDETLFQKARELKLNLEQVLKTVGLSYRPLTATSYLRVMRTMMNHGPDASWRHEIEPCYDDSKELCQQILDTNVAIDVDAKGLWLGEHCRVRTLNIKQLPERVVFGDAMRFLADHISGQRGIREPAVVTANIYFPDHEGQRGRLETDQAYSKSLASRPLARYVSSFGKRSQDLDDLVERIGNGDRLVECYLGIGLFAPTEEAATAAVTNARAFWREANFLLMEDSFITLELFKQLLPFAPEPDVRSSLMRYKLMTSGQAIPLLPIMGAWRGSGTPLVTLLARDGQVMGISPFDSETNFNACVAATSGSGKSFFMNEMIANFRAINGRVWVIDVGYSYKPLCDVLGGQYIEFGRDSTLCINPFEMVQDFDDESDVLSSMLAIMAAPTKGLDDYQLQGLKRVLAQQFGQHRQSLTIDLLITALMTEEDKRLRDVGEQLFSFSGKGEYGRYFNGKNTANLRNPFVVLELEALKQQPHLQRVVLLVLLYQIQQEMFLGDRAIKKMMVIDEAWDLMGSAETRNFIIALYRRVRKANGCVTTITQGVVDYWANPGTVAMIENSANKYLLRQTGEAISAVQKDNRLELGEWGYQTLRSVHTVKGEFSEILSITNRGTGVGRLVVSDFNKLLYSTDAPDVSAIKRYRAQGLPVAEAVNAVLRDRKRERAA